MAIMASNEETKTLSDILEDTINYLLLRMHEGPTLSILIGFISYFGFDFSTAQATALGGVIMALLPNQIELHHHININENTPEQ